MARDDGKDERRAGPRINCSRLPSNCAIKLAGHPNQRTGEALGHPVRRQVLREIHRLEPPCSADDLSGAESLRSESISTIRYHLKVLQACEAIERSGELVTVSAFQPLYVSSVTDDDTVRWILRQLSSDDGAAGWRTPR